MTSKQDEKRLLTVREAAEYAGLKPHSIRALISSSLLPVIDLSGNKGKFLIDKSDLDNLIDTRKQLASDK